MKNECKKNNSLQADRKLRFTMFNERNLPPPSKIRNVTPVFDRSWYLLLLPVFVFFYH